MRDILTDVERWKRDGRSIALATVIHTWGSSPRSAGAKMALTPDGKITARSAGLRRTQSSKLELIVRQIV
jgi:xanthine/CO dehydrogenase XdhC/CoxF family maturation factor